MDTLDDINAMKKLDPMDVLGSTGLFADQCKQAWEESSAISFGSDYKDIYNVVVCGMGGSRFTPKTIKELYRKHIKEPYEIVEDYSLPGYVDHDTLVILSSYSGTTEEVLSCYEDAKKRGARITAVSASKIIDGLAYVFNPKYNPSGQPRIGGGYLLMGHLGILQALHLLDIEDKEVADAIAFVRDVGEKFTATVPTDQNLAKQLATLIKDKHVFIITAEFLKGFGNGFANQINETGKMISDYRYIPELNHHLMEGLKRPETLHQNGLFLFFKSHCYNAPVQKRFGITRDVVEKQHVATHEIELTGPNKLSQVLEAFTLSGFTTFYLAMLYDTDPVAIPWVTYFKDQLAK